MQYIGNIMFKLFQLEEANKLLPAIEIFIKSIKEKKKELVFKLGDIRRYQRENTALGISKKDKFLMAEQQQAVVSLEKELLELINAVENLGCCVKDLDEGLIDFPTIIDRNAAYLCWKIGESEIKFWHGVEEGYKGRKPLSLINKDKK